MPFTYTDESLEAEIRALTPRQMQVLASKYTESYIYEFFEQLRVEIAEMLIRRLQDEVLQTFHSGYSGRGDGKRLFESFYYRIDGDSITISNTKDYFEILNRGFGSFDMKEGHIGQFFALHLPGGGKPLIRRVTDQTSHIVKNLNKNLLTKKGVMRKTYATKNWIHPGIQGKHLYEKVQLDMRDQIRNFVKSRVQQLLQTVYAWDISDNGTVFYNYRDASGRFLGY